MSQSPSAAPRSMPGEVVVLLDPAGNSLGTADKVAIHTDHTPLHLAFSCYVFSDEGALLVTRRALSKRVFPGVWTNSVCGHPGPGEGLDDAVRRRASSELGLDITDLRLVLPRFCYRAGMAGIVENEWCPVLVARAVGQELHPDPGEVEEATWVPWGHFAAGVRDGSREVSPWCRLQVQQLLALGPDPGSWPTGDPALLPPALPAGAEG